MKYYLRTGQGQADTSRPTRRLASVCERRDPENRPAEFGPSVPPNLVLYWPHMLG